MSRNGYYPMSNTNENIAHVTRGVVILMLAGLIYCGIEIRDDTRDFKKELPKIQEHLNGIDKQMEAQEARSKTFATKAELTTEATRVTNEFKKQLEEQIRRNKLHTGPSGYN